MKATINGEERELPAGTTVATLLDLLGAPRSGIAVARNEAVIRRTQFEAVAIADGDAIEIIKAVAGG